MYSELQEINNSSEKSSLARQMRFLFLREESEGNQVTKNFCVLRFFAELECAESKWDFKTRKSFVVCQKK